MKTLVTFCMLGFMLPFAYAQKQITVMTNEKSAGINFITNAEIRAKEWVFPKDIRSYYIDTANNRLTIQLGAPQISFPAGTGKIALVDLNKDSLLWAKSFNYNSNSLLQNGDIIIQARADGAFRLSTKTGKKQWRLNSQLYYIDEYSGIGLGYSPSAESSKMEGFRLSDGKPIWWRNINREFGWNDITHVDDGVILLGAAGIHIIDLRNGSGWDYETVTGSKDYTGTVVANAAGIILGALTGYYSIYSGYDLVSEICSNVWSDSTGYYFASREKIARLDEKLNPLWTSELPRKKASKSEIFIQDSLIYMINHGYAIKGGRQVYFGNPFFAAFNKENGRQVFMHELSDKKELISDYLTGDNMVICLFKDRIAGYSLQDGFLNYESKINQKLAGHMKKFSTHEFFVEVDSGFYPVELLNPFEMHISTDSSTMIVLNDQFEITKTLDCKDFYTVYHTTDALQLLWKDNKTIVINNENVKVAEVDASRKSMLIGKKLYDVQDRKIIEFDLSDLMEEINR